jgi:hypothetical protein
MVPELLVEAWARWSHGHQQFQYLVLARLLCSGRLRGTTVLLVLMISKPSSKRSSNLKFYCGAYSFAPKNID